MHPTTRERFIRVEDDPTCLVIRTWEDLYDYFLLPKLLARPPLRLYPRPLIDFAKSVLLEPQNDIDWWYNRRAIGVRTVLGDVLKQTAVEETASEFSAVAMEFAGSKYETALYKGFVDADRMCLELIGFLDLRPAYIRRVKRGDKTFFGGNGEVPAYDQDAAMAPDHVTKHLRARPHFGPDRPRSFKRIRRSIEELTQAR